MAINMRESFIGKRSKIAYPEKQIAIKPPIIDT